MNRENILITLLAVLIVFIFFYPTRRDNNSKAIILNSEEQEFLKPIEVVWRGEIISTMVSGSCIGLKGEFDNYRLALACLPDEHSNELWKFEGMVIVTGKWLGITCAYKNTIFGECVPDVSIENIKMISVQQVSN